MARKHDMRAGYGITHTLEETALLLGVTRERVRQLQAAATERLHDLMLGEED